SYLAQHAKAPREAHWAALKRLLRYLKGTLDYGILLKSNNERSDLQVYADAEFAGSNVHRKSFGGFVILFGGSPVSWRSKKQSGIAQSTTEAELVEMSNACRELVWLLRLLGGLG